MDASGAATIGRIGLPTALPAPAEVAGQHKDSQPSGSALAQGRQAHRAAERELAWLQDCMASHQGYERLHKGTAREPSWLKLLPPDFFARQKAHKAAASPASSQAPLATPKPDNAALTRFPWQQDPSLLTPEELAVLNEFVALDPDEAEQSTAAFRQARAAHLGLNLQRKALRLQRLLPLSSARLERLAKQIQLAGVPDQIVALFGGQEAFSSLPTVPWEVALAMRKQAAASRRQGGTTAPVQPDPSALCAANIVVGQDDERQKFIQLQLFHQDRPQRSILVLQQERALLLPPPAGKSQRPAPPALAAAAASGPAAGAQGRLAAGGAEQSARPTTTTTTATTTTTTDADANADADATEVAPVCGWCITFPEGMPHATMNNNLAKRVLPTTTLPGRLMVVSGSEVDRLLKAIKALVADGMAGGWHLGAPKLPSPLSAFAAPSNEQAELKWSAVPEKAAAAAAAAAAPAAAAARGVPASDPISAGGPRPSAPIFGLRRPIGLQLGKAAQRHVTFAPGIDVRPQAASSAAKGGAGPAVASPAGSKALAQSKLPVAAGAGKAVASAAGPGPGPGPGPGKDVAAAPAAILRATNAGASAVSRSKLPRPSDARRAAPPAS